MEKLKTYLIYLFVFLLPWQTRWIIFDSQIKGEVFEYGRMCLYSFDVIFLILVLILCLNFLFNKILFFKSALSPNQILIQKKKLFYLFVIVFIGSNIFLAENQILAGYWWLRIAEGLIIFYLFKKMQASEKIKVAWSFVISLAISASLGIYQFFTQHIFASKWLGLASQQADELGASVLEVNGERILRAYGSFPHPNVLAGFIVVAMGMLIILKFSNIKYQILNIKKEVFYILFTIALFFTFSRAGWLALGLLIIEYNILYISLRGKFLIFNFKFLNNFKFLILNSKFDISEKQKSKERVFALRKYIFLCLGVFIILSIIYWPIVQIRLGLAKETARLEIMSTQERISGYIEAYQIIKQHPWGVGLGNYTLALQKISPNQEIYYYQPVHNVFLLIVTELGWGWVLAILGLIILKIKNQKSKLKNLIENKKLIFFLSVIFMMFFLDHFWWTSASGMVVLVFFMLPFWTKR